MQRNGLSINSGNIGATFASSVRYLANNSLCKHKHNQLLTFRFSSFLVNVKLYVYWRIVFKLFYLLLASVWVVCPFYMPAYWGHIKNSQMKSDYTYMVSWRNSDSDSSTFMKFLLLCVEPLSVLGLQGSSVYLCVCIGLEFLQSLNSFFEVGFLR